MKKILLGAPIIFIVTLILLTLGTVTQNAPNITYVYSSSMEPTLSIGDGFFVLPVSHIEIGDIVLYRPLKLDAELITHRIIGQGTTGFITQGDHSISSDQAADEPELTSDRIIGKVLVIQDKVLKIPYLLEIQKLLSQFESTDRFILSSLLTGLGFILMIWAIVFPKRKRKQRIKKWRIKHLYQALAITISGFTVLSLLLGSSTHTLRYLVTESPGDNTNHVKINKKEDFITTIKNESIWPVYNFVTVMAPIESIHDPLRIDPFSTRTIALTIPAQSTLGWYQSYFKVYQFATILPLTILKPFFDISPILAIIAYTITLYLWLLILITIFEKLFKVEGWMPLSVLKDKAFSKIIDKTLLKKLRLKGVTRWE